MAFWRNIKDRVNNHGGTVDDAALNDFRASLETSTSSYVHSHPRDLPPSSFIGSQDKADGFADELVQLLYLYGLLPTPTSPWETCLPPNQRTNAYKEGRRLASYLHNKVFGGGPWARVVVTWLFPWVEHKATAELDLAVEEEAKARRLLAYLLYNGFEQPQMFIVPNEPDVVAQIAAGGLPDDIYRTAIMAVAAVRGQQAAHNVPADNVLQVRKALIGNPRSGFGVPMGGPGAAEYVQFFHTHNNTLDTLVVAI